MMTTADTAPARHRVFTLRSLQACLEHAQRGGWGPTLEVPSDGTWGVAAVAVDGTEFVLHTEDLADSPRIVILSQGDALLGPVSSSSYVTALERVHRVALEAEHPPVSLPLTWSGFWADNRIAFFATPRTEGALRWIAEIRPLGSDDTVFWRITTSDDQVPLEEFEPPYDVYSAVVGGWSAALEAANEILEDITAQSPDTAAVQPTIDLAETTFGAVTRYQSYSDWLGRLTEGQRSFLSAPADRSVKLRGPSGSGKTLALELKALKELYAARGRGETPRILFATHSWAMADQIDAALRQLDEFGGIDEIEVYPLVFIAQSVLPAERAGFDFSLLGEDSLSGKQSQIELLDGILDSIASSDWLFYSDRASQLMRERMSAQRGSPERNSLVWDLLVEFAAVLSAHGILPGINAERQYLALQRTPWMMPLEADADRLLVLLIYTRYVAKLSVEGVLTTDQLINDFLNYLETFTWNIRRQSEGYDLIFVDELHLFSDQERLALHYLTRSAEVYPRMFMALDPRQSPAELYVDVSAETITRAQSGLADEFLGEIHAVDLTTVHRFTPEILDLVRHINQSYPALGLGEDWSLDLSTIESAIASGAKPTLVLHDSVADEMRVTAERLASLRGQSGQERVALIVVEPTLLPEYAEAAAREGSIVVIAGRDDVEALQYTRRSAVVGAAEYLAGLQFGAVVVAGLPHVGDGYANLGHQRRRFLSLLYLAISRATAVVEVHVSDERGGVPAILEGAVQAGALLVEN